MTNQASGCGSQRGSGNKTSKSSTGTRRTKRRANFKLSLIDDESSQAYVKQFCSPNLRISESNGYRQEQKVQFVVDAVYAMAHALHKAWSHLCGAQPGVVCEALKELNGKSSLKLLFQANLNCRNLKRDLIELHC